LICFGSPSLRTGRADFPHPALQSVVLPARGLAGQGMGFLQAIEPKLGKVGVGPARLIGTVRFGTPLPTASFAQAASKPTADPAVFNAECRVVAEIDVLDTARSNQVDGHTESQQR